MSEPETRMVPPATWRSPVPLPETRVLLTCISAAPNGPSTPSPWLVLPEMTELLTDIRAPLLATTPNSQLRTRTLSRVTSMRVEPLLAGKTTIPVPSMFPMVVFVTVSSPPPLRSSTMPRPEPAKLPSMTQSSMKTSVPSEAAPVMRMLLAPRSVPLMLRFRRRTVLRVSPARVKPSKRIETPTVPLFRMVAFAPVPSMVTDFTMPTTPKLPESRTLIWPLTFVFEIAPAKVLQGAVRLHGLTSSPTPETHGRVWACAATDTVKRNVRKAKILKGARMLAMYLSLSLVPGKFWQSARRRGKPDAYVGWSKGSLLSESQSGERCERGFLVPLPTVRSGEWFYAKFAELSMTNPA